MHCRFIYFYHKVVVIYQRMHKTDIYLSQAQLYHQHMESTTMGGVQDGPHHGWSRVLIMWSRVRIMGGHVSIQILSVGGAAIIKAYTERNCPHGAGEGNRVSFERSKSFPIKIYHDQGRE